MAHHVIKITDFKVVCKHCGAETENITTHSNDDDIFIVCDECGKVEVV